MGVKWCLDWKQTYSLYKALKSLDFIQNTIHEKLSIFQGANRNMGSHYHLPMKKVSLVLV